MTKNFIPENFNIPATLDTGKFHLEMLSPAVAEMDYEAVMSSRVRLRSVFGENTKWPEETMSLSDNVNDLKRHQEEFLSREAFAYTVLTPAKDICIGCIYIDPCEANEFDCEVYIWVRDEYLYLDNELFKNVRDWLIGSWPFKTVAFPGRKIPWKKWNLYKSEEGT